MFHTYPVSDSIRIHALIPHFVGFLGMYWTNERRPLKLIILSSIDTCAFGMYTDLNGAIIVSSIGRILYSLS